MSAQTLSEFILLRNEEELQASLSQVLIDDLSCPVCGRSVERYLTPATLRGYKPDRPDRVEPCNHELTPEQAASCHRTVVPVRVNARARGIRVLVEEATRVASAEHSEMGPIWDLADHVLTHLGAIWADHPDYRDEWTR